MCLSRIYGQLTHAHNKCVLKYEWRFHSFHSSAIRKSSMNRVLRHVIQLCALFAEKEFLFLLFSTFAFIHSFWRPHAHIFVSTNILYFKIRKHDVEIIPTACLFGLTYTMEQCIQFTCFLSIFCCFSFGCRFHFMHNSVLLLRLTGKLTPTFTNRKN